MTPIDYRTATFDLIKDNLAGKRRLVYDALRTLGPQTTRDLAALARMDILTVRPRVTELIDLGLVELVPEETKGEGQRAKEGTYRALSMEEAMLEFNRRHAEAVREEQLSLPV